MVEPNLAGLADAQARLTQAFGDTVVLLIPVDDAEYEPGTVIDPETSLPINPWTSPASGSISYQEVVASASVAYRPFGGGGTEADRETAVGIKAATPIAVIIPDALSPGDGPLEDAERVFYNDRLYRIEDKVKDTIPSRTLLFCEPL